MTGFLTVLAAAAVLTGTILSVSAEAYAIGVRENNARKGENSSDKVCAVSFAVNRNEDRNNGNMCAAAAAFDRDEERNNNKVCAISTAVDKNNKGKIDNIAIKAVSKHQDDRLRTRPMRISSANHSNKNDRNGGRSRAYAQVKVMSISR